MGADGVGRRADGADGAEGNRRCGGMGGRGRSRCEDRRAENGRLTVEDLDLGPDVKKKFAQDLDLGPDVRKTFAQDPSFGQDALQTFGPERRPLPNGPRCPGARVSRPVVSQTILK